MSDGECVISGEKDHNGQHSAAPDLGGLADKIH
jgi:hypothetical protein